MSPCWNDRDDLRCVYAMDPCFDGPPIERGVTIEQSVHSVYLRRLFEVSYLETASAIHMVTGEIRYSKDLVKKREKF